MLTPIAGSILSVHAHAIGASHGPLVELDMKADHTKMRLRCVEHHGQKCTRDRGSGGRARMRVVLKKDPVLAAWGVGGPQDARCDEPDD